MMNESYTAEDFAQATFARHENGRKAVRFEGGVNASVPSPPWQVGRFGVATDEAMAAEDGWVPVVEADGPVVTEGTLRDSQEKAARKREKLVDHIADQDRVIRRRNEEITALRERVRVAESGRLSLARLAAAWEAAEQADECREGDVLIIRDDEDNYLVRRMEDRNRLDSTARILSRAPREPWQDLADSLEAEVQWIDRFNAVDAAQALHAAGWRKDGDDE